MINRRVVRKFDILIRREEKLGETRVQRRVVCFARTLLIAMSDPFRGNSDAVASYENIYEASIERSE